MRLAITLLAIAALGCASASYDPETKESRAWAFGRSEATASAEAVKATGGPLSDGIVGVFKPLTEAVRGLFGGTTPNVIVNVPDEVIVRPAPTP